MSLEIYQENNIEKNFSQFSKELNSLKNEINNQEKWDNEYIIYEEFSKWKLIIPAHIIWLAKENIKNGEIIDNILQKNTWQDAEMIKDIFSKETLVNICSHFMDTATLTKFNVLWETDYLINKLGFAIENINFFKKFALKKYIESWSWKNFEEKCKNKLSGILSKSTFIISQILCQSILNTKKVYIKEAIPRKDNSGKVNIKDYPSNYKWPDKYKIISAEKKSPSYIGNITPINTNIGNLRDNIKSASQIKKISKLLE